MSVRVPRSTRHDTVQLPSGTNLEYTFIQRTAVAPAPSPEQRQTEKLAICLHPWSWLGGRMNDPVLQLLTEPLLEKGYDVLRYNSRGVGKSTGWASLTGSREADDLKELVAWARTSMPNISSLVLVGYSYGSLIASLQPTLEGIQISHILLSYPVGPRHWLTAFHSSRYTSALQSLVCDSKSNVLILYGDADDFTSVASYDAWATTIRGYQQGATNGPEGTTPKPGKLEIVKVEGGSHFWREEDAVLRFLDTVQAWLP